MKKAHIPIVLVTFLIPSFICDGINVGGVANTFFPKGSGSGSLKDVATAVAEKIAGTEINFAKKMTKKAKSLRDFQNRVPKTPCCEIFKIGFRKHMFARFSKCRPTAYIL